MKLYWNNHLHLVVQVAGLSQLDRLSAQQPTAAQLLFSSVSSFVAPLGQPNYAAANAILNAHANSQTSQVKTCLISHYCTSLDIQTHAEQHRGRNPIVLHRFIKCWAGQG